MLSSSIKNADPELYAMIQRETCRQFAGLELIASEVQNICLYAIVAWFAIELHKPSSPWLFGLGSHKQIFRRSPWGKILWWKWMYWRNWESLPPTCSRGLSFKSRWMGSECSTIFWQPCKLCRLHCPVESSWPYYGSGLAIWWPLDAWVSNSQEEDKRYKHILWIHALSSWSGYWLGWLWSTRAQCQAVLPENAYMRGIRISSRMGLLSLKKGAAYDHPIDMTILTIC